MTTRRDIKTSVIKSWQTSLGPVLAVCVWELAARGGFIETVLLPAPSAVGAALWKCGMEGILWSDVASSLKRVGVGYVIGASTGFIVGIMYMNSTVRRFLRPLVELLRPIPPLAWIPLSLLWFGFGDPPAYFLVSLGAFFPVLSSTHLGFARVEVSYVRAARVLGLGRLRTFSSVILPQAYPAILTGLRTAMGFCWMIVVTAELVGAQSGLGYMIQISRAQLQTDMVVGGMLVIGAIGFFLHEATVALERILVPWRFRGRELSTEA